MINGECIYCKTIDLFPGWLLRKMILGVFQESRSFLLQEIGCSACCIKSENGH